jgi:hypothetical protein
MTESTTTKQITKVASAIPMKEFNPSLLKFSSPSVNKYKSGSQLFVNYNDNRGCVTVQTPMMSTPFGARQWLDSSTNSPGSASLSLALRGIHHDEPTPSSTLDTKDKLMHMDKMLLEYCRTHSKIIFGKEKTMENIKDNYNSIVKKGGEQQIDMVKFKIPLDSTFSPCNFELFDTEGHSYEPAEVFDLIKPGCQMQVIFKRCMVYFIPKGMWGLSMAVKAIRFRADTVLETIIEDTGFRQFVDEFEEDEIASIVNKRIAIEETSTPMKRSKKTTSLFDRM